VVFNELTAGIPAPAPGKLLVAPHDLRERFTALIRREAGHARAGRPCGMETILRIYEQDNCSAWDMQPDGDYVRRHPAPGEARRGAQQVFIELAASQCPRIGPHTAMG
jgi:polyphosphate kinase